VNPPKTDWRSIVVLLLAGLVAAGQVGKAAIAIPLLRQDLGLSLLMASWVVGSYGVLGAVAGLPAGIGVSRIGARTAVIVGLSAVALGSALGAIAASGTILLLTRVLEGCGFLALVVAAPTMLRNLSAQRDQETVLTWWSAYMPGGTALMMLVGPLLTQSGWQPLWLANGLLAAATASLVWLILPRQSGAIERDTAARAQVVDVLGSPGPILLSLAFGAYTFHYFALTGLLPTLLVERMGLSVTQAGAVSAITVVANALGNLAAGIFLRLAVPLWAVMMAAFTCIGLAPLGIFSESLPVGFVAVLACASLGFSGLVPGSIFAATPRVARHSAALAVTLGLLVQTSNLGQVFGPAALGAWVDRFGWSSAPLVFIAVAVVGVAIALQLRSFLRANNGPAN
jgi:MFS family permease